MYHLTDECNLYVYRKSTNSSGIQSLIFDIEIGSNNLTVDLADIAGKCFQHDIQRVSRNYRMLQSTFPNGADIIDDIETFFCPKPALDNRNACSIKNNIVYFAKSTQIPWSLTDYIVPHECGHVIQYYMCPILEDVFAEYLKVRSINEKEINYDQWDSSPQEWFAEDFRFLFGYEQDEYWGLGIDYPTPKVRDFMLSLIKE